MKKILVPTDFSENARNAVDFSVAIANQFGSEIHLLYTYKIYSTAGMFVSVESFMEQDAIEDMSGLIKELKPTLKNNAVIHHRIIRGDTIPVIADLAEKEHFDLIIMGTQGASGLKEIFTGSITNGVIKASKVPVLAVPSDWTYQPFQHIIFAVDEGPVTHPDVAKLLVDLAASYKAKILVFHQNTDEGEKAVDGSILQAIAGAEYSIHLELDESHIVDSINDFAEEYQAGLLCMIRRKRSFLDQIFHSSITSKEAFHCKVPLLVLRD
ncbi:MAG: universal stress protein [Lewinellaceae bacterium]|nr:universal stress protein [Lewinella sp.]MCB9279875.1 universal stress protein [Lewinellaceae bacterium]